MKTKKYNWLARLINRITKSEQSNNDYFNYYGHRITLQSGTRDYVDVHISDMDYKNQVNFTFDFWTYDLVFFQYNEYEERDAIVRAFKEYYGHIDITDEPWDEEVKFYEPMIDNDEYDQESVKREYNELMNHKAA